jgi:transposase
MFTSASPIVLSEVERHELQARAKGRTVRAEDAQRARLILLLADGRSYVEIEQKLDCSQRFIRLWRTRFLAQRLDGLYARHQGRKPAPESDRLEAQILAATRQSPPDGSTHWSCRKLARHLGVPHMRVARVWARAGLQPHRFERYLASNDSDFETKAADVIALYLNPPQHAVVFSLDEKTAPAATRANQADQRSLAPRAVPDHAAEPAGLLERASARGPRPPWCSWKSRRQPADPDNELASPSNSEHLGRMLEASLAQPETLVTRDPSS